MGAIPPVDLVVISHDHYDRLDYRTIRALAKTDVPFLIPLGVGAHLEAWGVSPTRITELDWWESHALPESGLVVTATPSQHFSGRTVGGGNATLWSSFVLRTDRHSVFFSGDTGLTTEYEAIGRRLGPFDLVMLEAVEPNRNAPVEPWWRSVDSAGETARDEGSGDLPSAVPWPID